MAEAPGVSHGIFVRPAVVATVQGPSGGPEILCLLDADSHVSGYWYGHLQRRQNGPGYVSCIAWLVDLIDAPHEQLIFERFHKAVREELRYEPCISHQDGDTYAEAPSFREGIINLANMIRSFDRNRCNPEDESAGGSPEFRIIELYGLSDLHLNARGTSPQVNDDQAQ
jgi:hypothetical protein